MALFGSKERRRQAVIRKAEELAGALQLEFYKSSEKFLQKEHLDKAGKISAILANQVYRFGYISEDHALDQNLLRIVDDERSRVLSSFSSAFKTNSTGALILLGAAWSLNLTDYKRHMQALAADNFVQVGKNTPNVGRDLLPSDMVYMYELTTL